MYIEHVPLDSIALSRSVEKLRRDFDREYLRRFRRVSGRGLYAEDDWKRISTCYDMLSADSGSFLDVGVGPGALLNLLTLNPHATKVCGIDIREYSKLVTIAPALDIKIMSVDRMTFLDDEFDTVICMEVLEHIELPQFRKALEELRRVAKRKLFMTVPLNEPEPLPPYHKLRFTLSDVNAYFPAAEYRLMSRRKGVPWLGILETF